MKMMVPHDCHALLKERTIVTEATSLVITVHPCCNVMRKFNRTNTKDNDKSNVLLMWRKKKMKANECQCFSLGCFHFLFL